MRVDEAIRMLKDIYRIASSKNDDPLLVVKEVNDDKSFTIKPISNVHYCVGNGEEYFNLSTGNPGDDAVSLSQLINELIRFKWPYNELKIDFNTIVNKFSIDLVDNLISVVVAG